jgi:hypothetical protein
MCHGARLIVRLCQPGCGTLGERGRPVAHREVLPGRAPVCSPAAEGVAAYRSNRVWAKHTIKIGVKHDHSGIIPLVRDGCSRHPARSRGATVVDPLELPTPSICSKAVHMVRAPRRNQAVSMCPVPRVSWVVRNVISERHIFHPIFGTPHGERIVPRVSDGAVLDEKIGVRAVHIQTICPAAVRTQVAHDHIVADSKPGLWHWAGPSGIRLAIPIGVPRGGGWLLNDRQSHKST